jgi:hypothetical protein
VNVHCGTIALLVGCQSALGRTRRIRGSGDGGYSMVGAGFSAHLSMLIATRLQIEEVLHVTSMAI